MKMAELSVAAPQVVAHRVARMAAAGPTPNARDRAEFHRMGAEKTTAFWESWMAMGAESLRMQTALATSLMGAAFMPLPLAGSKAARALATMQGQQLGMLGKGLAPVHRKAVANAKRLGKLKR
jgi:hypothetical protein